MSGPTPGPWRLTRSGLMVTAGPPDPEGGFPQGRPVAAALPGVPLSERAANARLIASCPELYEALVNLVNLFNELEFEGFDTKGANPQDWLEEARAAIARAAGP